MVMNKLPLDDAATELTSMQGSELHLNGGKWHITLPAGEYVIHGGTSKELKELREENARLRAQLEWQPIESAPKDTRVEIIGGEYMEEQTGWEHNGVLDYAVIAKFQHLHGTGYVWLVEGGGIMTSLNPTHWRPLQDAPKEGK